METAVAPNQYLVTRALFGSSRETLQNRLAAHNLVFKRSLVGSGVDDVVLALEILRFLAPEHVYEDVVFRQPGRERYPDPKDWFM